MTDPTTIVFTVKELLQRLDERLGTLDQKLDLRLAQIDERITHVEREQTSRQHLIEEHKVMRGQVERLWTERAGQKAIYADRRFWAGLALAGVPLAALVAQHFTI